MPRTIVVLLCLLVALAAGAQNKIDRVVEKISTVGTATFTTAVDRNPQSREVQKVVKVLTISGAQASSLLRAFRDEQDSGSFYEEKTAQAQTLTLSCETDRQHRLYTLRLTGHPGYLQAKCTIIVLMKSTRKGTP